MCSNIVVAMKWQLSLEFVVLSGPSINTEKYTALLAGSLSKINWSVPVIILPYPKSLKPQNILTAAVDPCKFEIVV